MARVMVGVIGGTGLGEALGAHLVHAAAEDLVDEVLLAAEVVVHRRDVDVGLAGHLAQRRAAEPVLGEEGFRRVEDAFGQAFRAGQIAQHVVGAFLHYNALFRDITITSAFRFRVPAR